MLWCKGLLVPHDRGLLWREQGSMASLQLTAVRTGLLLLCQKAHFDKVWASSEETLQPGEVPQMEPVVFLSLPLISTFYQEAYSFGGF